MGKIKKGTVNRLFAKLNVLCFSSIFSFTVEALVIINLLCKPKLLEDYELVEYHQLKSESGYENLEHLAFLDPSNKSAPNCVRFSPVVYNANSQLKETRISIEQFISDPQFTFFVPLHSGAHNSFPDIMHRVKRKQGHLGQESFFLYALKNMKTKITAIVWKTFLLFLLSAVITNHEIFALTLLTPSFYRVLFVRLVKRLGRFGHEKCTGISKV
jgi:hypothetical protein